MSKKYFLTTLASASLLSLSLQALPSGCHHVSGKLESIQSSSDSLHIESGGRTILEWDDFQIQNGEVVKFLQKGNQSAVLNRVIGSLPTLIEGQLQSNGQVILLNSQGIMIGENGVIETAGFIASTSELANENFMLGQDLLFTDPGKGTLVHFGTINSPSGDVYLIAKTVLNEGEICAPEGGVAALSSSEVLISPNSDKRIFIKPGDECEGEVENRGTIEALSIRLQSSSPYEMAVKSSGRLEALERDERGGRIYLVAERGGVHLEGELLARGEERGGTIHLLGQEVTLDTTSLVDVSGLSAGGEVLIGGDYRGQNPDILNSRKTTIEAGAKIQADALKVGDGGMVIVWSRDETLFSGEIRARGAGEDSYGGFTEVSSSNRLAYKGQVDLSSDSGRCGELLLDPKFALISPLGTDPATGNLFASAPSESVTISGSDLASAINSASVVIEANTDITFSDTVASTTSGNGLTLSAGRSIMFSPYSSLSLTNGALIATINDENAVSADRDAGDAKFIGGNSSIETNGGAITLGIGSFGGTSLGEIRLNNVSLNAGGGDISLTGAGYSTGNKRVGVACISTDIVTSGTGAITLTGTGGNSPGANNCGVYLSATSDGSISTLNGPITLTGVGGGSNNGNPGVRIEGGVVISSSGTGTITINGDSPVGTYNNLGVSLSGSDVLISVVDGNLAITGNAFGSGRNNQGIRCEGTTTLSSTGSGTITLIGNGGDGSSYNCGILFSGSGALINGVDGAISLTGVAGSDGADGGNQGVRFESGARITATALADVTIAGTGGAGIDYNMGVIFSGDGSGISVVDGDVSITAIGQGTGNNNQGFRMEVGAQITSSATGGGSGNILVDGTGGDGLNYNNGVSLSGRDVLITSVDGNIDVVGTGQGSGTGNTGVVVEGGAIIHSTGSGVVTITSNDP